MAQENRSLKIASANFRRLAQQPKVLIMDTPSFQKNLNRIGAAMAATCFKRCPISHPVSTTGSHWMNCDWQNKSNFKKTFRPDAGEDQKRGRPGQMICDLCNSAIVEKPACLLGTKDVVTSKDCWAIYLKGLIADNVLNLHTIQQSLPEFVGQMESSDTPWALCENCKQILN